VSPVRMADAAGSCRAVPKVNRAIAAAIHGRRWWGVVFIG